MADLPGELREALDELTRRHPRQAIAAATTRLIDGYRSGTADAVPSLRTEADVAAYVTYRMPATYAAARATLAQLAAALPTFRPRSQADVGGGTGAAVWAAADQWPSLESVRVLDQAPAMLAVGTALAARARQPAVRDAEWRPYRIGAGDPLPTVDLATLCYLLGELPAGQRGDVVGAASTAAAVVVVVEPGTPAGHARVLAARDRLIADGLTVLAPCPHQRACPLLPGQDWCHFGVRLSRTPAHRQAKGGALGYEDEKFSYVAAARSPDPLAPPAVTARPMGSRVLRRPGVRKGLVALRLCTPAGTAEATLVSKRHGDRYRVARDVRWGDTWPPDSESIKE